MRQKSRWPNAVLFDLDGTLLDNEDLQFKLYKRAASSLSVDLSREEYEDYLKGLTDEQIVGYLCRRAGVSHSKTLNLIREKQAAYLQEATAVVKEIPGAHGFLAVLERRHIPLAVVTSASHDEAVRNLGQVGLLSFFDAVVCIASEELRPKPSPDAFLRAADKLAIVPSGCLVYEDSTNGVAAALAAGMTVVGISNRQERLRLADAGAILVIANYLGHSLKIVRKRHRGNPSST